MDDQAMFAVYFAAIVSMGRHHPGAGTRGHERPSLTECRAEAAIMVDLTNEVFQEWDGEQQRQQ